MPYPFSVCWQLTLTSVLTMLTNDVSVSSVTFCVKLKSKTSVSGPRTGMAVCGGLFDTCMTVMLVACLSLWDKVTVE